MSKYKGIICRGSYLLGSACGHCERCKDEMDQDTGLEEKTRLLYEIKITIENKLIERTEILENTLKAVLKRWKYDADQGDGIHETDYRLYNRAMKLIDKDYEPE